ncbi:MAG: hypothetical protein ACLVJ6_10075 [Merdibacter sp.]
MPVEIREFVGLIRQATRRCNGQLFDILAQIEHQIEQLQENLAVLERKISCSTRRPTNPPVTEDKRDLFLIEQSAVILAEIAQRLLCLATCDSWRTQQPRFFWSAAG